MRTPLGMILFIVFILALDFYIYSATRSLTAGMSSRGKTIIYSLYWSLNVVFLGGLIYFANTEVNAANKIFRTYVFALIVAMVFSKILASTVFLIDDIRRGIQWLAAKWIYTAPAKADDPQVVITRSQFLTWAGTALGAGLFGTLAYGFSNKYNYRVRKIKVPFPNLPAAFHGLRIVHFSDVHAGSFTNKKAVADGIAMIQAQKADLIIFSGDLVNDRATEMDGYADMFSRISGAMGVYATLGNHDYGGYASWPHNGITKEQNLQNLSNVYARMGWKLLNNEHVVFEKDGDKMALLGVENWGALARFPKRGDLTKAATGTEDIPFKVLVSHDPSHWDAQIRPLFPDIDLTLSGHTHGMQFGVELPGFQWSPVQYIYKQWKGLYETGHQKLYVNPGFGFIGYPGRVGILPEITVIDLVKA